MDLGLVTESKSFLDYGINIRLTEETGGGGGR